MCTKTYRSYCRYYLLEIHTLVTLTVTCLLRPIKRYLSLPSRFIRLYLPPFSNVLVYKRLFIQDYFLTAWIDLITQSRNALFSILLLMITLCGEYICIFHIKMAICVILISTLLLALCHYIWASLSWRLERIIMWIDISFPAIQGRLASLAKKEICRVKWR